MDHRLFTEFVESFRDIDPITVDTVLSGYRICYENESPSNSMVFWHGGNLDKFDDVIAQKNGRYEFGPGLYATTHYNTARKYSKGGRKLYRLTIDKGTELNSVKLPSQSVIYFIRTNVIRAKQKDILSRLSKYGDEIPAYVFMNVILNEKAIKPSGSRYIRQFLINSGIDYEIVQNAFGWGETMIVLYNMKKISKVEQITPKDKIEVFDLPTVK